MELDETGDETPPQTRSASKTTENKKRVNRLRPRQLALLLVALILTVSITAGAFLPPGVDWSKTFRPAALALMQGHSPYTDPSVASPFAGPPWALLPLASIAFLPEELGRGFFFALSLAGFATAALRLRARPLALAAFLCSPPVLHCLLNANIDWMPLLGFTLPPVWGLFLVMVKPQMGFAVAIYWLVESLRKGGVGLALRTFAPAGAAYLLSFALFGFWPAQMASVSGMSTGWNASLWPASIPIGLVLLTLAISRRNPQPALAASPLLSPYVLLHSWAGVILAVIRDNRAALAAGLFFWLLVALAA